MKKILLMLPLLFWLGCEEEEEVLPFVGTWAVTNLSVYDNENCTGDPTEEVVVANLPDSVIFEIFMSIEEDGTSEMTILQDDGTHYTGTGTWSESSDGTLLVTIIYGAGSGDEATDNWSFELSDDETTMIDQMSGEDSCAEWVFTKQ